MKVKKNMNESYYSSFGFKSFGFNFAPTCATYDMALKEIWPVLYLDHMRMNELATGLGKVVGLKVQRPVQSNICLVHFARGIEVAEVRAEVWVGDIGLMTSG